MADEVKGFNDLLSRRIKELQEIQTTWVVVKSVDWDKKTMIATGVIDGLDYFNVLLGLESDYKKPKVNSKALIGIINNQPGNSFLIVAEQLEELHTIVGDTSLIQKPNGYSIKKGNESLKAVFNDMIDEVNKIIVINGTTINVAAMNVIKQRLNSILID